MKNLTVITGANSGNGLAIARRLAKEDYPLLLLDLKIDTVKKEFNSKYVMCSEVDVTNYKQFEEAIREAEAKFGPVENMINNAGVMILELANIQDPAIIKKQNDININGVMYGTQIALKSMIQANSGTIINISSIAGIKGFPNHSAYCGTKFAVRGYSETVRGEVAQHGIRVSIISPGVVKTNLLNGTTNHIIKANYEKWRDDNKAFLVADDIARSVQFIIEQPQNMTIRELVVGPTTQVE